MVLLELRLAARGWWGVLELSPIGRKLSMGSDAVDLGLDKLHEEVFSRDQEDFVLGKIRGTSSSSSSASAAELFKTRRTTS